MDTSLSVNLFDNTDKLFFTLGIIVAATFLISQLLYKLGKPIVMAGIIAGFIIHQLPLSDTFFDINTCKAIGVLGITLFMMLVGSQLDYQRLIQRKINVAVCTFPLIIPFIIGYICSIYLAHVHLMAMAAIHPHDQLFFNIFFSLAISMTAFPLLSIFLTNNQLINSKIAQLALFCASVSEAIFWIVLGLILLYFQQNAILTYFHPLYIIFYLLFIFGVAPRLINYTVNKITTMRSMLGFVVVGCLLSAALADVVNLHQVFGGFIFGLLLPRNHELIKEINYKLSDLVNSLLLPAYFVKSGINLNLKFIWSTTAIFLIIALTIIASLSKFGGAIITGRFMGYNITESTLLGSLLNIRGIFEIMLLNIGLEVGLISDQLYTVLIIMTLITTFMSTSISPWISKYTNKQ